MRRRVSKKFKKESSQQSWLSLNEQQKILAYFTNDHPLQYDEFIKNWAELSFCDSFTKRDLHDVLKSCALKLPSRRNQPTSQKIAQHISDNFSYWFTPFKKAKTTGGYCTSNAAWSLYALQANFINTDFRKHYLKFRRYVGATADSSVMHSDFLFFGKTIISPHNSKSQPNEFERDFATLLEQAGFKVYFPHDPHIPGLKQAIDLVAIDDDGNKIAFELDGPKHFDAISEIFLEEENIDVEMLEKLLDQQKHNVSTLSRAALCSKIAPEKHILHVSYLLFEILYHKHNKFEGTSEHLDYIRALFTKTIESPPGNYDATTAPHLITSILPAENSADLVSSLKAAWFQAAVPPTGANDNGGLLDRHARPHSKSLEIPAQDLIAK